MLHEHGGKSSPEVRVQCAADVRSLFGVVSQLFLPPHCRQSVVLSSKSPDFIELDLGMYFGPAILPDFIELNLGLWDCSEACCSQYPRLQLVLE